MVHRVGMIQDTVRWWNVAKSDENMGSIKADELLNNYEI